MPPEWMPTETALRFFGLDTEEELEDLVLELGVETEVADDGRILAVSAEGRQAVLHKVYERNVGHRPDDPDHVQAVREAKAQQEETAKQVREQRRQKLVERKSRRDGS